MTVGNFVAPHALAGNVILVSGAGRGLGKSMALALAGCGADLILAARSADEIGETAKEIEGVGGKAMTCTADVTRSSDVAAPVEAAIDAHGRIDVLVNNAGMNARNFAQKFEDIPENEWNEMVQANLTSVFLVTQAVGRTMLARGAGKSINIGSFFAFRGQRERLCYGVNKAGIVNLTKTLAAEWAGRGITVNCFCPGSIDLFPGRDDQAYLDEVKMRGRGVPLGRLGQLDELAPNLAYLASEVSNYMTGETITLDGGWLAN